MNFVNSFLGEAKICELEITVSTDHDVFRLQIAIKNMIFVQVLEGQEDVGRIELGSRFLKSTNTLQIKEQLATRTIFKHIV